MWTKSALLVGAVCASVANMAAATAKPVLFPHVPLLFWSDRAMFNTKDAYLDSVFDEKETVFVLNNAVTRDTDKDFYNVLNHEHVVLTRPEVLAVFVHKNLQTDQLKELGESSYVKHAIKSSASSVVVPHTTRSGSLVDVLKEDKAVVISLDKVDDFIRSPAGHKLLNNDETELLVVQVPEKYSLAAADKHIKKAVECLQKATDGHADFALTGDVAPALDNENPFARRRLASSTTTTNIICDAGYLVGVSSTGKAFCFSHYVRMTPGILTALIFGFFFLFLAYVGISVLHAIQTPLRYPHHGPPKGKEF